MRVLVAHAKGGVGASVLSSLLAYQLRAEHVILDSNGARPVHHPRRPQDSVEKVRNIYCATRNLYENVVLDLITMDPKTVQWIADDCNLLVYVGMDMNSVPKDIPTIHLRSYASAQYPDLAFDEQGLQIPEDEALSFGINGLQHTSQETRAFIADLAAMIPSRAR